MTETSLEFGALLKRLASRWRQYAASALAAGAVMYGLTFLMPTWYRSMAVILPPEETDQLETGLPVQRFLSRMPSLAGLSNYYTPSDIFKAILASRTVQQSVIDHFDLQRVYKEKSPEKTLRLFRTHVRTVLAPDGTISVAVEDRSRERAARLANSMIEELDRFNVERRNFQARRTRVFLERRVAEMDSLSRFSDASLRRYQEVHHVVAPVQSGKAEISPVADLMAKKMSLEVQLAVLHTYLRSENERVIQVRTELERLNDQIASLPGVETELGRLARDARLYQEAFTLLSVQLEDARLRETMDTPTLTVLDPGIPAERRARPIRIIWVAGAMALATLGSILWSERRSQESRAARAAPSG